MIVSSTSVFSINTWRIILKLSNNPRRGLFKLSNKILQEGFIETFYDAAAIVWFQYYNNFVTDDRFLNIGATPQLE